MKAIGRPRDFRFIDTGENVTLQPQSQRFRRMTKISLHRHVGGDLEKIKLCPALSAKTQALRRDGRRLEPRWSLLWSRGLCADFIWCSFRRAPG